MILHTGGLAFGEISTKSNSASLAIANAFSIEYTPCSMSSPTTRTSCARIFSLILCGSSCLPNLRGGLGLAIVWSSFKFIFYLKLIQFLCSKNRQIPRFSSSLCHLLRVFSPKPYRFLSLFRL